MPEEHYRFHRDLSFSLSLPTFVVQPAITIIGQPDICFELIAHFICSSGMVCAEKVIKDAKMRKSLHLQPSHPLSVFLWPSKACLLT